MRLSNALLIGLLGCGTAPRPSPSPRTVELPIAQGSLATAPAPLAPPLGEPVAAGPPDEVGRASYYADSLSGNSTASGEPYDPVRLTAAHRKLPFGTVVDVRRPDTGAMVRVRINDRGPFGGRGRVIDLSRRAAEELDMMKAGVVDVELWIVK